MKPPNAILIGSLLAAWFGIASVSGVAQTVVKEVLSTHAGIVTLYEPVNQTLIVTQGTSSIPVTYSVTQATTFVDESGATVAANHISSGLPVVVHFIRQGDRLTASRVVVKKRREPR